MLNKSTLTNSIEECKMLLQRLEEAAEYAPGQSLHLKRYPSGQAVPYLVTGPRSHRCFTRMDTIDKAFLEKLMRKTFARKVLPQLQRDLKVLEKTSGFQDISFYQVAASLGPEYRSCADHFLGYPDLRRANPAFDILKERQNIYEFDSNAVRTELGVFRTKSESIDAEIMANAGIEFKYEVTLQFGGKWINVDFVVNLYWKKQIGIIEHHGLLDDPGYRKKKLRDLATMMNHGVYPGQNLLILSESEEYGFDAALAKKLILAFCLP